MYAQTIILLALMIVVFWLLIRRKVASTIAMLGAAVVGVAWSIFDIGAIEAVTQLVEGSFLFFNIALVVFCSTFFINVLRRNGSLNTFVQDITRVLGNYPALLLIAMTGIVVLPGAITGSGTAAVMATGGLVSPVLLAMGIPLDAVAAIVAFAGTMGMVAPPVNIPAMMIAEGVVLPYIGFTGPLFWLSIPAAIIGSLIIGVPWIRKQRQGKISADADVSDPTERVSGIRAYLGLLIVLVLMILTRIFPHSFPVLGLPLIFVLGALAALVTMPRKESLFADLRWSFVDTVQDTLLVNGVLMAAGTLIQIMALTGVRGLLVVATITLPSAFLYVIMVTLFPIVGGILTSFGAATVLGVPLMLSFLGKNSVIVASALSAVGGLGVLIPPTGIVGIPAAQAVGYKEPYSRVLRQLIVPWIIVTVLSVIMIMYSDAFSFLV